MEWSSVFDADSVWTKVAMYIDPFILYWKEWEREKQKPKKKELLNKG